MVKNDFGSTRDPPVTIEVSAVTDVDVLPPERLKQLAQIITRSPPSANLGLDNSVFGKVKQISLSSFLNHSIQALPPSAAPASSPAPSPVQYDPESPSVSPSRAASPSPLPNFYVSPPCFDAYTSVPSYTSHAYAPTPGEEQRHPPSHITASPVPSQSHASVSYNPSGDREKWIEKGFVSTPQVSSAFSSSPSCKLTKYLNPCYFYFLICVSKQTPYLSGQTLKPTNN